MSYAQRSSLGRVKQLCGRNMVSSLIKVPSRRKVPDSIGALAVMAWR